MEVRWRDNVEHMTHDEKCEALAEIDPDMLLADGFEDAPVGYAQMFNRTVVLYDRAKCIEILMKRDGMTEDAAEEFFEFNVMGSYVGEYTPGFMTFFDKEKIP